MAKAGHRRVTKATTPRHALNAKDVALLSRAARVLRGAEFSATLGIEPTADPSMDFVAHPDVMSRGVISSVNKIFLNPDIAWRTDRTLQNRMRNDPDVDGPLELRVGAAILQSWDIESDDPEDPEKAARCAAIKRAIERIPQAQQMLRNLAMSAWYGHAAVNLRYAEMEKPWRVKATTPVGRKDGTADVRYRPVGWMPLHPDSVVFDFDGHPHLKVNRARWQGPQDSIVSVEDGSAVRLTEAQRAATIISVSSIEAASYEDIMAAALPYWGRGLRSALFYYWFIKQTVQQLAIRYCERMAGSVIIGKYPAGNAAAKAAMETVLKNLENDATVTMPVGPDETGDQYGVDFCEPTGTGYQVFAQQEERLTDSIRRRIVGQTLTTGTAATGLGSGVAEVHERTFGNIVRLDCESLADSLSTGLVDTIARVNWDADPGDYRLRFAVDVKKLDEWMQQVERFVNMGGRVAEREVRGRLDLSEPAEDEQQLGGRGLAADPFADVLRNGMGGDPDRAAGAPDVPGARAGAGGSGAPASRNGRMAGPAGDGE